MNGFFQGGSMNFQRLSKILSLALFSLLTISGCGQSTGSEGDGEIKITFHDTRVEGSNISRIDMTILETQIIDINDVKTTISTDSHTFNLLEITKNNPVVLAHTSIAIGTYKQIRLILDPNTTVTLTDGTVHSIEVPSGEQTGIKIDGVFEIPSGRLYTLDIDLDPGKSVHYAKGNGYMLKPVIELSGSDINSGNFFYAGAYGSDRFVIALGVNNEMVARTARYPKYIITGVYSHDGVNRKLSIVPLDIQCPSCSRWEKKKLKWFGDVPAAQTYDVISFGADFIALKDAVANSNMHLERVPTFSYGFERPTKDFVFRITGLDEAWTGDDLITDKILFGELVPADRRGIGFSATSTISVGQDGFLEFSIPKDDFSGKTDREYILTLGVVNSMEDLVLSSDGTVTSVQNLVMHNFDALPLFNILRDTEVPSPVVINFFSTL